MSQFNDMSDILREIRNTLEKAIEEEEQKLVEEVRLLTLVYEEAVDTAYVQKSAVDLTSTFAVGFIESLCPTLYTAIETS